ncbi:MAG: glycoside hydrolase family 32 protein [Candidatus Zipacnadales bacterium]
MCLLGGNRLHDRDTLYLCSSPDLVNWTYRHAFYEGNPQWRRPDEDCSCPDFFALRDRYVLMCITHAIGGRFYAGRFEAQAGKFYPESHVRMNWPGSMYFAPESLQAPDGRRIFWAWVTDPRIRPAQELTGSGFQSLPRVLDLLEDGTPLITPARELERLRRKHYQRKAIPLPAGNDVTLTGMVGAHVELAVELDPGTAKMVGVKVHCTPDGAEETAVWYVPGERVLRVDMSHSTKRNDVVYSSPPFSSYALQRPEDCPATFTFFDAPLTLSEGEPLRLRVFIDGPMLEVFANDRQCVTQVVFPESPDSKLIRLCAKGGTALALRVDAWTMAPLKITNARQ